MILENPKILQILKLVTFKEPAIVITNRHDVYPIRGRLVSVSFDMLRVCMWLTNFALRVHTSNAIMNVRHMT